MGQPKQLAHFVTMNIERYAVIITIKKSGIHTNFIENISLGFIFAQPYVVQQNVNGWSIPSVATYVPS